MGSSLPPKTMASFQCSFYESLVFFVSFDPRAVSDQWKQDYISSSLWYSYPDSHSEKMDTGTVNTEIQLLPEKPHLYFSHVQSLQLSSTLLSSYWTSSIELNILQIISYPQTVTLCILLCETNKEASYLLHTIL